MVVPCAPCSLRRVPAGPALCVQHGALMRQGGKPSGRLCKRAEICPPFIPLATVSRCSVVVPRTHPHQAKSASGITRCRVLAALSAGHWPELCWAAPYDPGFCPYAQAPPCARSCRPVMTLGGRTPRRPHGISKPSMMLTLRLATICPPLPHCPFRGAVGRTFTEVQWSGRRAGWPGQAGAVPVRSGSRHAAAPAHPDPFAR